MNHAYTNYRVVPLDEAVECVEKVAQLPADLAEAGWDTKKTDEVLKENMGAMGLTPYLDLLSRAWS